MFIELTSILSENLFLLLYYLISILKNIKQKKTLKSVQ